MALRTATRRATAHRRALRTVPPVEHVLLAPLRPLVRHVHRHLSTSTFHLDVAVPVRVTSSTHPVRVLVLPAGRPLAPAAAGGVPGVVFRDPVLRPTAPASVEERRRSRPGPAALRPGRPGTGDAAASTAHRPAPTRVAIVHREPGTSSSTTPGPATHGAAETEVRSAAWRAAAAQAAAPTPPGATPLTAADVPGVVDHVVREIDRRLVASRERRGWTA